MYRKATRAALLLLPLLGANNFLAVIYPPTGSWLSFAIWTYVTQFLLVPRSSS